MVRKVDHVWSMGVAAVRHVNDGREHMWLRNVGRGYEIFAFGLKIEHLSRIVGSHCFNSYGRVPGHGTRLFVLVAEKKSEVRRSTSFKDGNFNEAVTEVHEEAVVRSAFDVPAAVAASARTM